MRSNLKSSLFLSLTLLVCSPLALAQAPGEDSMCRVYKAKSGYLGAREFRGQFFKTESGYRVQTTSEARLRLHRELGSRSTDLGYGRRHLFPGLAIYDDIGKETPSAPHEFKFFLESARRTVPTPDGNFAHHIQENHLLSYVLEGAGCEALLNFDYRGKLHDELVILARTEGDLGSNAYPGLGEFLRQRGLDNAVLPNSDLANSHQNPMISEAEIKPNGEAAILGAALNRRKTSGAGR